MGGYSTMRTTPSQAFPHTYLLQGAAFYLLGQSSLRPHRSDRRSVGAARALPTSPAEVYPRPNSELWDAINQQDLERQFSPEDTHSPG